MTIRHAHHGVANARRTRLGAGWTPNHHTEPREYLVTDGPVANDRRARVLAEDGPGLGES